MNTLKVILFLLGLVIYVVIAIAKKAQEHAAAKRAREDQARRRLEELRTGRVEGDASATVMIPEGGGSPGPVSHQEATRRLQEMAERRRQQLDELRKRASQGGGAVPQTAPPAPQREVVPVGQGSSPASAPRSAPPARRTSKQAAPQRRRDDRRGAPQSRKGELTQAERLVQQARQRAAEDEDRTERLAKREADQALANNADAVAKAASAARAERARLSLPSGKNKAAEWRRIILMREILSPPLAMREDRDVI